MFFSRRGLALVGALLFSGAFNPGFAATVGRESSDDCPFPSAADPARAVEKEARLQLRAVLDYAAAAPGSDPLEEKIRQYPGVATLDPEVARVARKTVNLTDGIRYFTRRAPLVPPDVPYGSLGAKIGERVFSMSALARGGRYLAHSFDRVPLTPFKVYLTLKPERVRSDLPSLVGLADKAGASALKFSVVRLEAPDRVVVHFRDFGAAQNFARQLADRYAGVAGDPLPFTHRVGPAGSPVFLGVDEIEGIGEASARSWRTRVAETIADGVYSHMEKGPGTAGAREVYVTEYLKRHGIDPTQWLPVEYVR